MYHAILSRDLRELCAVLSPGEFLPASLHERLQQASDKANTWGAILRHPDGGLAFFNDTNLREPCPPPCPPPLAEGHVELEESGYHRLRRGPWHLLWDCGAIGPDHQPGHAHADILSLELSLGTSRLFVNTGLRGYADDPRRAHVRSTRAHNTVQIGSDEQIELWGSFRVGARGRPLLETREISEHTMRLVGSYAWPTVPGSPIHRRAIQITRDNRVQIEDRVEGARGTWTSRFHLHPEASVETHGDELMITTASGRCRVQIVGSEFTIAPSSWHPEFGRDETNQTITIEATGDATVCVLLEALNS